MKIPNTTFTAASLAIKYKNPTADQQAAARKIQLAVGENLTGITTINQPSTFGPQKNNFLRSNIRQITNNSKSPLNQLSRASASKSYSLGNRFLLLYRALALGFESENPNRSKSKIHCTASFVDLATKVPSLRALARRMTEANSVTLQSVLKTTGKNLGRGDWFSASNLKALNEDSTDDMQSKAAFALNIDLESFRALARDFGNNPIRADETVSLAKFTSNVSELLAQRRGFLMPSPRAILKPLSTEKFFGDAVAVAELNLQVSESVAERRGFQMPSWAQSSQATLTSHEIEQLVDGTGGDSQAVARRFEQLLCFRSQQTATVDEIE